MRRTRSVFGAAAAVLALCAGPATAGPARPGPSISRPAQCRMAAEDESWLRGALAGWNVARRRFLGTRARPLPPIITFDARCSYSLPAGSLPGTRWRAAVHDGRILLPNGARVPASPQASNTAIDGRNVLVMSLPSIWRPVAPRSGIPLAPMLEGIMFHELVHAYQAAVTPSVSFPALQARLGMESLSDDSVEERYGTNAAYVRDFQMELGQLERAAAAPNIAEARELTCAALAAMRRRRARYFAGADAQWAEVDEVSVTAEGLANWLAYAWLTRRYRLGAETVRAQLGRASWSQAEGLTAFLVIDRLVSGWQRLLLGSRRPETVAWLLARACGRS